MPSDLVLLSEPLVDDDRSLPRRRKPFGFQYLAAQGFIEAFVVSVLRTWFGCVGRTGGNGAGGRT